MIIDGRIIAKEILERVKRQVNQLAHQPGAMMPSMPTVRAITVAPNAVTESYLRIKTARAGDAGMMLEIIRFEEGVTEGEILRAIERPGASGIIVQLPLPAHLDEERILAAIPVKKDVDVLSPEARATKSGLIPPVAAAVVEILKHSKVALEGKNVVVLGRGRLVGEPVARCLSQLGANVSTFDMHTFDPAALKSADILISGTGSPHLVTPDMISKGAVLIDAGTSEQGGEIVGDIDPACAELASVYTPVPGGIGPITIACLFRNVLELFERF